MNEKFHILIAEDDPGTRMLLTNYFSEKGYEVFSAVNGLEGIKILEQQVVDLVMTDYIMPGMGGKDFILRIKRTHPRLPIILISGLDRLDKELKLIKRYLYAYFEKPVSLGPLSAAIKKAKEELHYT